MIGEKDGKEGIKSKKKKENGKRKKNKKKVLSFIPHFDFSAYGN